ncbi:hypothetical protein LXL04_028021 [Taraxacum kok-saghyz]
MYKSTNVPIGFKISLKAPVSNGDDTFDMKIDVASLKCHNSPFPLSRRAYLEYQSSSQLLKFNPTAVISLEWQNFSLIFFIASSLNIHFTYSYYLNILLSYYCDFLPITMTGEENQNKNIPITEKPGGISHIRASVPFLLDYDHMNYDAWRELFETHCCGCGVADHLRPPKDPASSNMEEWERIDSVVKSWIYSTLTPSLLQIYLKKKSNAYDLWSQLETVFRKERKFLEIGRGFNSCGRTFFARELQPTLIDLQPFCSFLLASQSADSLAPPPPHVSGEVTSAVKDGHENSRKTRSTGKVFFILSRLLCAPATNIISFRRDVCMHDLYFLVLGLIFPATANPLWRKTCYSFLLLEPSRSPSTANCCQRTARAVTSEGKEETSYFRLSSLRRTPETIMMFRRPPLSPATLAKVAGGRSVGDDQLMSNLACYGLDQALMSSFQ